MLCFVVLKRSIAMQLNLIFPGSPEPDSQLWATLDEETRLAILERLVSMMTHATGVHTDAEAPNND